MKVLILARDEVGSHDSAFVSGSDGTGEHTTEGVESSFVVGRYHFGDVHHERCLRVEGLMIACKSEMLIWVTTQIHQNSYHVRFKNI